MVKIEQSRLFGAPFRRHLACLKLKAGWPSEPGFFVNVSKTTKLKLAYLVRWTGRPTLYNKTETKLPSILVNTSVITAAIII